jgi:LDH2 family malate/lactate/ureidoglycolate dehydrogenase
MTEHTTELPPQGPPPDRVGAAELERFIAGALAATGLPEADAGTVASLMVEADLTGADAHGVFRLPQYVERIRAGGINPNPSIDVRRTGSGTAVVDGDNGMGHLVMSRAAEMAVSMAREAGIAWVAARRSNHAGSAGLYAAMAVPHGMIGIYSAVASANHMAVWGGREMLLGTNPLAVAIPCGDEPPIVLDMATTAVSYGTIKNYVLQGRRFPEGWMVDRTDGTPITDPARAGDGMLLPIGGYKGSGLALILGLLAGPLSGAAFGRDVVDFNADPVSETNTGHFILALDIARFIPPVVFYGEVNRHLADLRASERLAGCSSIRLPGDRRASRRAERLAQGIPIPAPLLSRLNDLAASLSIPPLAVRSGA